MANIKFGEGLRRARIRNGMTQGELAGKIEVTQGTISIWETGKGQPNGQQKKQLKMILGGWGAVAEGAAPIEGPNESSPGPLSSWVTKARLRKELSIPELAAKAGISAAAIYAIEAGRIANPQRATIQKLEKALGELPAEAKKEIQDEAEIEGLGPFTDFGPYDTESLPEIPGVYVFYDISERPIYVGESSNIRKRIHDHVDKFWFKPPIVNTGAYVEIKDAKLRTQTETMMIRFLKSNAVINTQNVIRNRGGK